jgi:DNA-directed RNA polymerase specialized sigma24 family protein
MSVTLWVLICINPFEMQEILQIKTPLTSISDEKIIEGIKNVQEENELKFFQYEFYNRFAGYIYKVALYKFRNFNDPDFLAREVLQKTFITAYEKIFKFKFPSGSSPKDHTKIIKAWLGRIAENESKKAIGKTVNENIEYDTLNLPEPSYDQFEDIYGEPIKETPNEFRNKLQLALNVLSVKEKHIILTYAGEDCIDSDKHLSKSALNYLCQYYETTSASIRQCKKRALDKIKKSCFE